MSVVIALLVLALLALAFAVWQLRNGVTETLNLVEAQQAEIDRLNALIR
jgi:uncharacterized membrane protein YqjE